MSPDSARAAVATALADIAPDADLSAVDPAGDLREQVDIDSMDFLRLVQALHAATGVAIPEADYPKVGTLDGLVAYLAARGA